MQMVAEATAVFGPQDRMPERKAVDEMDYTVSALKVYFPLPSSPSSPSLAHVQPPIHKAHTLLLSCSSRLHRWRQEGAVPVQQHLQGVAQE